MRGCPFEESSRKYQNPHSHHGLAYLKTKNAVTCNGSVHKESPQACHKYGQHYSTQQ